MWEYLLASFPTRREPIDDTRKGVWLEELVPHDKAACVAAIQTLRRSVRFLPTFAEFHQALQAQLDRCPPPPVPRALVDEPELLALGPAPDDRLDPAPPARQLARIAAMLPPRNLLASRVLDRPPANAATILKEAAPYVSAEPPTEAQEEPADATP